MSWHYTGDFKLKNSGRWRQDIDIIRMEQLMMKTDTLKKQRRMSN